MEFTFVSVILLVGAYLLGSIPTAVWVGRAFYNIDVREHGSKNAGATNTMRVLGRKPGIIVLIIDMLKGFVAVSLVNFDSHMVMGTPASFHFEILLGAAAIIGHIAPVFAGFRGGKGVATMFGVILFIFPWPTLVAILIWLISLVITRYVSISSMVAGLSIPLSVYFFYGFLSTVLVLFSLLIPILLIYTHRKNIARLRKGEEGKADFIFKKISK